MTLWLVRAGRYGESEDFARENDVVAIGWDELGNLSNLNSREKLKNLLERTFIDAKERTLMSWGRQLWDFTHEIKVGDLLLCPLSAGL
jgi:restriction system protein